MTIAADLQREFLRHTVATLAYRAAKTLRDAPDSFADFRAGETFTHSRRGSSPISAISSIGRF